MEEIDGYALIAFVLRSVNPRRIWTQQVVRALDLSEKLQSHPVLFRQYYDSIGRSYFFPIFLPPRCYLITLSLCSIF